MVKLIKTCTCWVAGAGGGSGSSHLQELCIDIFTICPGHAQSYPSSLHLFPSLSGICPALFTSVPVPFQHSSQSRIHWQVDFFSLLVTLLSSCSHLDLPVVFFPFTSGPVSLCLIHGLSICCVPGMAWH